MDVALGSTHVSFHRRIVGLFPHLALTALLFLSALLVPAASFAVQESSPMHWSADKTLWDRKVNRVELTGHATVRQTGEVLTADRVTLDLNNRILDAQGNCVYIASEAVIHGEEMHFNLDTRTGTIMGGRVSNDVFTLTGERINKLGDGHFQTHQGGYSTCKDCPQSWNFSAEDVDMEFEGYAYMSNVNGKIKDTPVFWLPYLVVPLKTRRQTGVLFPKFGFTGDGFRFVLPVFLTLGRSADMTLGLGDYGSRGLRGEWEGRYQLSGRSGGSANLFYLHDDTFVRYLSDRNRLENQTFRLTPNRWALDIKQSQELPFGVDEKLRLLEVSDNSYPTQVGDVQGIGEAYIPSDLIISHSTNQVSSYVAARRFRNLLFDNPLEFDPATVQVYPTAAMTTNERFILNSPIAAGLTVGVSNFSRTGGAFDTDQFDPPAPGVTGPRLGKDPIRQATRFFYTPSIYTTLRPFGIFSLVPSLEYRGFYYNFHQDIPTLSRGYLQFRSDLSAQLERIYDTSDPDAPRMKHLFRPIFTYSLIPYVNESYPGAANGNPHPFLQQIEYARANGFSGYNFDNYDIVPLGSSTTQTNYFVPQGNALTYGFTSQLIRRKGAAESDEATYQTNVELNAGQTYNFRSQREGGDQQPFSRLFSSLLFDYDKWSARTDYTYVPYAPISESQDRHILSTGATYSFIRTVHQRVLAFERSFSLGYSRSSIGTRSSNINGSFIYSLSDYILPRMSVSRDFNAHKWLSVQSNVRFQSPSQCWRFEVGVVRRTCDKPLGYCLDFGVDLSLNLTGSGFGGVSELATAATPR